MRTCQGLPNLDASHDEEVKMSDTKRVQIRRASIRYCQGRSVEGKDLASAIWDRGKSSLACEPGSRIGEPEKRKSVHAISNQGKLPEAIGGHQNRAFFGRSGCRILPIGGVCLALGTCGRIIMTRDVELYTEYASAGNNSLGESIAVRKFSDMSSMWRSDPGNSVRPHAGRHHYRCRMPCRSQLL